MALSARADMPSIASDGDSVAVMSNGATAGGALPVLFGGVLPRRIPQGDESIMPASGSSTTETDPPAVVAEAATDLAAGRAADETRSAAGAVIRRSAASDGVKTSRVAVLPWYRRGPTALGIVLVAILGASMLAKRLLRGTQLGRGGGLEVISRTHLSPKQSIALVQMGARMAFVGITPQSITTLRLVRDDEEAAALRGSSRLAAVKGERFDAALRRESDLFAEDGTGSGGRPGGSSPVADARRDVGALRTRLQSLKRRAAAQASG